MSPESSVRTVAISLPSTGEEEWQALKEPVMSGWLTQGPKVAAFERAFVVNRPVVEGETFIAGFLDARSCVRGRSQQ